MPLINHGGGAWSWGDKGHVYRGKNAKKLAIKNGIAIEGTSKFKEIMSGSKGSEHMNYIDLVTAGILLGNYEKAEAKIISHGNRWKILGVGGLTFSSKEEALTYQLSSTIAKKTEDNDYSDENEKSSNIVNKINAIEVESDEPEDEDDEDDKPSGPNTTQSMYTNNDNPTKPHLIMDDAIEANTIFDKKSSRTKQLLKDVFNNLGENGAKGYISKKERDSMDKSDFADPENEKYPIRNQHDLDSAVKLSGRSKDKSPSSVRENIKKIAKRKGLKLPESWS